MTTITKVKGRCGLNGEKGVKILRFEELSSTQDYAKNLRADGEDTVVIARRQTGGKGTKNRSFSSAKGGLYLSKLSFYENFPAKRAFLIMERAAVAVCKTLESYGFAPKIKWANDIFVNGKKICGILIENVFSGNTIANSVVGIGLNVNNDLPDELSKIAVSMREATGKVFDLKEVENRLLEYLNEEIDSGEYQKRLGWLGEEVILVSGDERVPATLLSVTERGELVAKIQGEERIIAAGEISLRVE